jgi:hypothetical protein
MDNIIDRRNAETKFFLLYYKQRMKPSILKLLIKK